MSDKNITLKFWQVAEVVDGEVDLAELLLAAAAKEPKERQRLIDGTPLQLEISAQQPGPIFTADVLRLQGEAFPSHVSLGERPKPLKLPTGTYLGHHTGFVYDRDTRLIGVEIRPASAGLSKIFALLKELSGLKCGLPLPILVPKAMNELCSHRNGKFSVRIADPASLSAADPELVTVRDNLAALKDIVDGAYINLTIGVGGRKDGLNEAPLMKLVGWLLGERGAERGKVRSLRVTQPGEETPLLDFIKAQVAFREKLPLTDDPVKDWVTRSDFLKRSLVKAKPYVRNPDGN